MIIYLHGFNSSPASRKAQEMSARMAASGRQQEFLCPELAHHPDEAIAQLESLLANRRPDTVTLVGSSLGGYYATWLAERHACRAVLAQPAVRPHVGLESFLGLQKNLYTGVGFELTRSHLEAWRRLYVESIHPERYLLLLETGDEVLDYRDAVQRYEGAQMVIREGGDHTLQSFTEHIPRILAFAGYTA